jgi:predicted RNase H-like HicB family nuclease
MIGYPIVVFWSDDDQAYVADVPDLAVSAWATTPEAALREVRLALADIFADAKDRGLVLPPPTVPPVFAKAS